MSIVYDYLKKIHDQKEPKKVIPVAPSVKKSVGTPFWVKALGVGILGCLLLVAGLHFFLLQNEKNVIKPSPVTQKLPVAPAGTPDLSFLLEGIIYNPSKPFAIFDGKMYEKGGRVGDYEVVEITPDTVLLKNLKDNTTHTARL